MNTVSIKNAEHYSWGNNCDGWHLVKSANLSVIQEKVPSGAGEVLHYHQKSEQFFYVLSGVATINVNQECQSTRHVLMPGQGLHVVPNTAHQLTNESQEDLIFIVTSTPPSHGDRVELND